MTPNPSGRSSLSNDRSNSQKPREIADCGCTQHQPGQPNRQTNRSENPASLLRANPPPDISLTEDHIHSLLAMRRARSRIFGETLFSDPAWDILLELYAAKLGYRTTSLENLARLSSTPLSTARRWVAVLEGRGLAQQGREPTDGVCIRISLTAEGASGMERLGNRWGSAFVSI